MGSLLGLFVLFGVYALLNNARTGGRRKIKRVVPSGSGVHAGRIVILIIWAPLHYAGWNASPEPFLLFGSLLFAPMFSILVLGAYFGWIREPLFKGVCWVFAALGACVATAPWPWLNAVVLIPMVFSHWITRAILTPRGLVRMAYAWALVSWPAGRESAAYAPTGALLAAAQACIRRRGDRDAA